MALRDRDFNVFWAGETVSLLGSEVTTLALPLTAIFELHASAGMVGLLMAARWSPYLVFALPAGVWIDRHRRRPVLVASDLGQCALLAAVPLLAWLRALTMPALLLIAFGVGSLAVFFEIAYRAYLPDLVARDQLTDANGRLSMSESIAEVGGPSFGGALVQLVSAPAAVLLDSLSFLASAAALSGIRAAESVPPRADRGTVRRDILDGIRITLDNRLLRAFAGEAASYNFFWQMIQAVLALYVIRELGLSAGTFGLVLAIGSVGSVLGATTTKRVSTRLGLGITVIAAAVIGDLAPLALPAIHGSGSWAVAALAGAFFLRGIGVTGCNVHVDSIRQTITPQPLLGRANASYRLLVYGVLPLGALAGGALGEMVGLRVTLLVGAAGLLTTALWLILSPVRHLQDVGHLSLTGA